jgi:hypothetical protein
MFALSILAALKVFLGAAVITDLIGDTWTGSILAALVAVDVGVAFYLQGQVVPLKTTVAYLGGEYEVRAGGAAIQPTGSAIRPQVEVGRLTKSETLDG